MTSEFTQKRRKKANVKTVKCPGCEKEFKAEEGKEYNCSCGKQFVAKSYWVKS